MGWPNSLLRCDLCEASACDCRLTVGDAAVVNGHGVGNQDGKTGVFELAREEPKQSRFMNTPPESATMSMPSRAQISRAIRAEERAMAIWKSSASLSAGTPASIPLQKRLKKAVWDPK